MDSLAKRTGRNGPSPWRGCRSRASPPARRARRHPRGSRPSRAEHTHARALLENAMRYVVARQQDGRPGLRLSVRGVEPGPQAGLLPPVVHPAHRDRPVDGAARQRRRRPGRHPAPLARRRPWPSSPHLVKTLRQDQADPTLSAEGLLGNFLDLATGKRLGPLASNVEKSQAPRRLRPRQGRGALEGPHRGRLARPSARTARRPTSPGCEQYGDEHFKGPLAPFNDADTRQKVLAILDARVVMIVFGDNCEPLGLRRQDHRHPALARGQGRARGRLAIRDELEQFLDAQQAGYARLYDPEGGLFYFGWDATREPPLRLGRPPGEADDRPHGLPRQRVPRPSHLRRRPVRPADRRDRQPRLQDEALPAQGRTRPLPCSPPGKARRSRPWASASAWASATGQAGASLLANVVDIEVDYSTKNGLPGFLSESYTGDGTQYSGSGRHPRDHRQPPPQDHRRRLALHPGRGLFDRPGQGRGVPGRELADHRQADHRPRPLGRIQRHHARADRLPDHRAHAVPDPRPDRPGVRRHEPLSRIQRARRQGSTRSSRSGEGANLLDGPTSNVFAWTAKGSTIESGKQGESLPRQGGRPPLGRDRLRCPRLEGVRPLRRRPDAPLPIVEGPRPGHDRTQARQTPDGRLGPDLPSHHHPPSRPPAPKGRDPRPPPRHTRPQPDQGSRPLPRSEPPKARST